VIAGSDRDLGVTIPRGPCVVGTFVEQSFQAEGERLPEVRALEVLAVQGMKDRAVKDMAVKDMAVKDMAVKDLAVKGLAVKGLAVEDLAVEDLAVEDLAMKDLGGNWRAACQLRQAHAKSRSGRPFAGANAFWE
jgi:hypothetical protein